MSALGLLDLANHPGEPLILQRNRIERQRAVVGGLPEQDWSLRVTAVWARRAGEWHLAHRHADPLTHARTMAQTAAIARGDSNLASG